MESYGDGIIVFYDWLINQWNKHPVPHPEFWNRAMECSYTYLEDVNSTHLTFDLLLLENAVPRAYKVLEQKL